MLLPVKYICKRYKAGKHEATIQPLEYNNLSTATLKTLYTRETKGY